jgi:D-alanyl-D-alanine carboxypeptidase
VQTIIRRSRPSRPCRPFQVAGLLFGAALLGTGATGANPSTPVASTLTATLRPISQVALQTMVASAARQMLIPGAVVLLRTPQGEFTATYGTTHPGATTRPDINTYFRIASNTKTMTAAIIVQQRWRRFFGHEIDPSYVMTSPIMPPFRSAD